MANNTIIKQSNQGIVLEETPVTLSDEKLNGMLLRTYEKAVSNVTKWRFFKLYGVLLSVAGTLFVTLFTSSFNNIGQMSADIIRIIVIIVTAISAILGFVFLGISVNQKKKSDTDVRDASIREIVDNYYKSKAG
jgi:hypothetical protein